MQQTMHAPPPRRWVARAKLDLRKARKKAEEVAEDARESYDE